MSESYAWAPFRINYVAPLLLETYHRRTPDLVPERHTKTHTISASLRNSKRAFRVSRHKGDITRDTIFNDDFLTQHNVDSQFNATKCGCNNMFHGFELSYKNVQTCNTLQQQIVALKTVRALCCVKNRPV